MDREKIDNACEKGILGLVLGILIFGPLAFGADQYAPFLVIQGLTIGVLALWALRLWVSARPQILWPPICWAVLAFMVYAVVRYAQADIEYAARGQLLRVLIYGFLFFAILNNLHRQETMHVIVLTLLFLGMAIACYGCYQYLAKSRRVWNVLDTVYAGRGSGTFIYPNHLAGFLEILLPLGLCYVLMSRTGHVTKIFLAYSSVVMLAGIGATLSRGGWVVTALELLLLCGILVMQREFRLQGLVCFGLLLLGAALVVPRAHAMQARVQQMVMSGKADDARLAIWQSALEIWHENFWWGDGPGHFDYRFAQHRPVAVQMRPKWVHNDYLNTLVDWGIAGTALVVSAWLLLYWGVLKVWRSVRGPRDDFSRKKSSKFALLVGASVGLAAILFHSAVDFNMQLPAIAILVATLMALLTSQWRFDTERFWIRAGTILKSVTTLILLAGMIYLGGTGWRGARECACLERAEWVGRPPYHYSNARIAALEQAFKVEPMNFETSYKIAECYRLKSWDGGDDYVALARQAIDWYQRGTLLNRYDALNWLGTGMCLDWIGDAQKGAGEDSAPFYQRANDLDPNSYFISVNLGWHYVQTGDLAAARTCFERSCELQWIKSLNEIGFEYLPIVERRLKEAAERFKTP